MCVGLACSYRHRGTGSFRASWSVNGQLIIPSLTVNAETNAVTRAVVVSAVDVYSEWRGDDLVVGAAQHVATSLVEAASKPGECSVAKQVWSILFQFLLLLCFISTCVFSFLEGGVAFC